MLKEQIEKRIKFIQQQEEQQEKKAEDGNRIIVKDIEDPKFKNELRNEEVVQRLKQTINKKVKLSSCSLFIYKVHILPAFIQLTLCAYS